MVTTQAMGRTDLRKRASEMREWDEEEIRMLDRALVKFPQVDLDTDEGLRGLIVQQGDDEGGDPNTDQAYP